MLMLGCCCAQACNLVTFYAHMGGDASRAWKLIHKRIKQRFTCPGQLAKSEHWPDFLKDLWGPISLQTADHEKVHVRLDYKFSKLSPLKALARYKLAIIEWGWVGYEELCRSRRVLSSEICIILHILWKLFRAVQVCKYTPNSRCRPSRCLLGIFVIFLIGKRVKCSADCSPFVLTTKTTQPRRQVLAVKGSLTCNFSLLLTSLVQYGKILRYVVNSSWLWWIMHVSLANQKLRNILNE